MNWTNDGKDGYGYSHRTAVLVAGEYNLEIIHNDELSLVDSFTGDSIIIDTGLKGVTIIKKWVAANLSELEDMAERASGQPLYLLSIA